MDWKTFES